MKAASEVECLKAYKKACRGFDAELGKILLHTSNEPEGVYKMLQYFMGFLDEDFKSEKTGVGGKRFRPALCLYIAESYGARETAFNAAIAIELFHNFTLIHDDVEDRDEMRRDRPTVWKIWGVNHAINSGDMLSLIACEMSMRAGSLYAPVLLKTFQEVIEGQYLDFELTDQPIGSDIVTEKTALVANEKKTAALIATAAECAGIAGKQSEEEIKNLHAYGHALGMVFQLADDYRSVWETKKETGKDSHSDIREHKRTLPFFAAHRELQGSDKKRLEELYSLARQLSEAGIAEALDILNSTKAKDYVLTLIKKYAAEAQAAAEKLSVSNETKSVLIGLIEMLMPKA